MYSELLPRLVQDRPEASSGHRASPDILSFGKQSEDGFPPGREQTVLDLTYRFCSISLYFTVLDSRSGVNSVTNETCVHHTRNNENESACQGYFIFKEISHAKERL